MVKVAARCPNCRKTFDWDSETGADFCSLCNMPVPFGNADRSVEIIVRSDIEQKKHDCAKFVVDNCTYVIPRSVDTRIKLSPGNHKFRLVGTYSAMNNNVSVNVVEGMKFEIKTTFWGAKIFLDGKKL